MYVATLIGSSGSDSVRNKMHLVFSTGEQHSVREFAEIAYALLGLDWEKYVRVDRPYMCPAEVDTLLGDSTKARESLG